MGDFNCGISSKVVNAISSVDYKQNSISKSYFSNDSVTHTMPDELLVEKTTNFSTGKQTDSPSSNGEIIVSNGDRNVDDFTSATFKNEDPEHSINNQQEKQIIEVTSTAGSGNSSTPLQLEFSDSATTTSAPSFWSGITGDDNFNPGVSPLKNTLSFQNFPNVSNQIYNSSLGAQISLPQSLPPQRRAITGAHNFSHNRHQQPQSNMLKTFSNWNNSQNTSWSAPQTPNGLLPWNTVNLVNQKRTVPNINPVCAQKKTPPAIGQHSVVISPSKFRRSTSLPLGKQFPYSFGANHGFDMSSLDENRDGNIVFPFQDHQLTNNMQSNSMDALRFPVEQQLLDIMRTTNADNQDHFKGYCKSDIDQCCKKKKKEMAMECQSYTVGC